LKKKNPLIIGTLLLASASFITRGLGFAYRIWLSRLIGSEGMGIYQLLFPILGICYSICCGALQTAIIA
jgi:stage V sporulation protein B